MTAGVQSRSFCFCIPVRFGVFVLSFVCLILSGLTAGVLWTALAKGPENDVKFANNLKIGIIVAGTIYTLFTLISLAGLLGSLVRSRALVRTFAIFLWFQLFASFVYSIAFSVALFDKSVQNHLVTSCVSQTNATTTAVGGKHAAAKSQEDIRTGCKSIFENKNKPWIIVGLVVYFLLTLYACIIVRRYSKQLGDENAFLASASSQTTQAAFQPSYYPHTPLSRVEPGYGAGGSNAYPFAQREHGFGSNSNNSNANKP
ncbi:hypothetical protein CPB86DRAFT_789125 [Serendipita vermifera]|jgi:hypothetical protein|nr:hypothetical protein CPB86DRAFT_789125 [Serendipita vermifera]